MYIQQLPCSMVDERLIMTSHQSFETLNTPTLISVLSTPNTDTGSNQAELDSKFLPTGITAIINTPIAAGKPYNILAINLEGLFGPAWVDFASVTTNLNRRLSLFRNLFPVAFTPLFWARYLQTGSKPGEIYYDSSTMPIHSMMMSHRIMEGGVGVALRITSNTSQSGNLILTRTTANKRVWWKEGDPYLGIYSKNTTPLIRQFTPDSFALVDLSLNRTATAVVPNTRKQKLDIYRKMQYLVWELDTYKDAINEPNFAEQFLEDYLMIGILADLPSNEANQISISFFFDYSSVTFEMPMLFSIANNKVGTESYEILNITAGFYDAPPPAQEDEEELQQKQILN